MKWEPKKNIWEDFSDGAVLATEPIDEELNVNTSILGHQLNQVLHMKEQVKIICDLAFDAADSDGSKSLEKEELTLLLKEVAQEMKITAPSDLDVQSVMNEMETYTEKSDDNRTILTKVSNKSF